MNDSAAPMRPGLPTVFAVAVVACASADMVHEALGHGIASWLVGDRILSISSVALRNVVANRFVSPCGTIVNCVAGALAFLFLRRARGLSAGAWILWLFGAFNLCIVG